MTANRPGRPRKNQTPAELQAEAEYLSPCDCPHHDPQTCHKLKQGRKGECFCPCHDGIEMVIRCPNCENPTFQKPPGSSTYTCTICSYQLRN